MESETQDNPTNIPVCESKNRRSNQEPKIAEDNLPHIQTLESDDGIPQDQGYPTRHEDAWSQKYQQHVEVHSTHKD